MKKDVKIEFEKENNLWRRLAAIIYDWLLLIAVILVAVSIFTISIDIIFGDHTSNNLLQNPLTKIIYQLYLVAVGVFFYVWFWTHGGQTLGMKVWKIKVVNLEGKTLSTKQALSHLFFALISCIPFGIGFFWALISQDKRTLYDRWSKTQFKP